MQWRRVELLKLQDCFNLKTLPFCTRFYPLSIDVIWFQGTVKRILSQVLNQMKIADELKI